MCVVVWSCVIGGEGFGVGEGGGGGGGAPTATRRRQHHDHTPKAHTTQHTQTPSTHYLVALELGHVDAVEEGRQDGVGEHALVKRVDDLFGLWLFVVRGGVLVGCRGRERGAIGWWSRPGGRVR